MTAISGEEVAANEVARAIIRRRNSFEVLRDDPFEDCEVAFFDGVETYYIDRGGCTFHTGDHWQRSNREYFRPAPHLLQTIRDLVRDAEARQRTADFHLKAREIING